LTSLSTPLWLSHHPPAEYDRCVLVGRHHVCHRCLLIWPVAGLAMFLALAGVRWPTILDWPLLILLPVPATAEFVLEHLGRVRYSRALQAPLTIPMAVGLGVGFERYLRNQADVLFWGCAVGYSAIWFAAAHWGSRAD
jgi:hypothetical protein